MLVLSLRRIYGSVILSCVVIILMEEEYSYENWSIFKCIYIMVYWWYIKISIIKLIYFYRS